MKYIVFHIILGVLVCLSVVYAQQNDSMIVEVDIFASAPPGDLVGIEVPDHVFLDDITFGEIGNKSQVYVNNTGSVNITITPQLSASDAIFSNLYFQSRKTGNNSQEFKIGEYSFNIEKPSTGGKRAEYFWMWLDLSNFSGDTDNDLLAEQEQITFVALPQI